MEAEGFQYYRGPRDLYSDIRGYIVKVVKKINTRLIGHSSTSDCSFVRASAS